MSAFFGRFPGLDPATGMLSLPLWAGGAAAALFVVLCLLAFSRAGREGAIGGLARLALVLIGASVTLVFFDGSAKRDLAAERRALDARALDLLTRAALPGSALACLDAVAGDTVEASCEKALFVTPETTAAAVSYVSAQLALLDDFKDHTRRARTAEPVALINLRRAAESDRFESSPRCSRSATIARPATARPWRCSTTPAASAATSPNAPTISVALRRGLARDRQGRRLRR